MEGGILEEEKFLEFGFEVFDFVDVLNVGGFLFRDTVVKTRDQ